VTCPTCGRQAVSPEAAAVILAADRFVDSEAFRRFASDLWRLQETAVLREAVVALRAAREKELFR
jgi:hypothetical protein